MKKLYCQLALFIGWMMFLIQPLFAQVVDTTYAARMNYIFKFLDKTKIPTGILKDAALELAELNYYNGFSLLDSGVIVPENFREIYLTLITGQLGYLASGVLPHPNLIDSIWFAKRKPGQVTLAGLFYTYSRFSDDAPSKVNILNDQIYDKYVNGIWQNPYATERAIAFSPASVEYTGLNFALFLPAQLWLSNSKEQVNKIEVNMDDGLGYRQLSPNVGLPVTYPDSGLKVLKFKLWLNNNTVLQCHSILQVSKIGYEPTPLDPSLVQYGLSKLQGSETSLIPDDSPEPESLMPAGWVINMESPLRDEFLLKSTETFNGKKAEGLITIAYANIDKKIRKPLIVAEGFDPDTYTFPEKTKGQRTYDDFAYDIEDSYSSELQTLVTGNNHSYDIIYIDWKDGTADMRLNALLLKTVIRDINQVKVPDGANPIEKNVVLGQSMGGVIARYALKKMELAGENHDVRLYISHDAPHQGANIPLGIQAMAVHLRYVSAKFTDPLKDPYKIFKNYRNPLYLTETMGAKQLLFNRLSKSSQIENSVFVSFQNELKNLGYPTQCRNISISNGSECGTPYPILPGDHLIKLDGFYKTKFLADIFLTIFPIKMINQLAFSEDDLMGKLPGSHRISFNIEINTVKNGGGNVLYKCNVSYKKKILWLIPVNVVLASKQFNSPNDLLTLDTCPGGTSLLKNYADESTLPFYEEDNTFYFSTYKLEIKSGFSFIPTTSALDIGKGQVALTQADYYQQYVGATPPPAPKNTPFDNFITGYYGSSYNEEHISFTNRNGKWLADELNLGQQLADCSFSCNFSSNSIQGPASICGTVNYSVPNLPAGTSVKWFASGSIQIQGANNLTTVAVKSINNGPGYLTALLSDAVCGQKSVLKTLSSTGLPASLMIDGYYFNNGGMEIPTMINNSDIYPVNGLYFSVPELLGVTYQWSVNGTVYGGTQNHDLIVYAPNCGTNYPVAKTFNVLLTLTNACGSTQICKVFYYNCLPTPNLEPGGDCIIFLMDEQDNFMLYPNPAANEVKIVNQNILSEDAIAQPVNYTLELFDTNGVIQQITLVENQQGETIINTSTLPNGIYYLHIKQGAQLIKKQVIIQH